MRSVVGCRLDPLGKITALFRLPITAFGCFTPFVMQICALWACATTLLHQLPLPKRLCFFALAGLSVDRNIQIVWTNFRASFWLRGKCDYRVPTTDYILRVHSQPNEKNDQSLYFINFYSATLSISAVFGIARCPSVCVVTLVYCVQMAEDIVKLFSRPDSPMILDFWPPAPIPNSKGNPFSRDAKYKSGIFCCCNFQLKSPSTSETVQDRPMFSPMLLWNDNRKSWVPD